MSPSEYFEYQKKKIRFTKLSNNEYNIENNNENKNDNSKKRIRFTSLELKKITNDELKNKRKFSNNI